MKQLEGYPGLCLAMALCCAAFIAQEYELCPPLPILWAGCAIPALGILRSCLRSAFRRGGIAGRIDPRLLVIAAAAICACSQKWWTCFFVLWLGHADTLLSRFFRSATDKSLKAFPGAGLLSTNISNREIAMQRYGRSMACLAIAAAAGVFLFKNDSLAAAAVLCAACPHAMAQIPALALSNAIAALMDRNTLVRSKAALEKLGASSVFITDKNGALTDGSTGVTDVLGFRGTDENEVVALAATAETTDPGPIGRAIIREAVRRRVRPLKMARGRRFRQLGCYAMIDGTDYQCGSEEFMRMGGKALFGREADRVGALRRSGKTVVLVADGANILGAVALSNTVRPHMKELVAAMRATGHEIALLSSDAQPTLKALADQAGILQISSGMKSQEKVDAVAAYAHDRGGNVIAFTHSVPTSDAAGVPVALLSMGPSLCSHAAVVVGSNDVLEIARARSKASSTLSAERWISRIFAALQLMLGAACIALGLAPLASAVLALAFSAASQAAACAAGGKKA
jgi:cation transport ATPase